MAVLRSPMGWLWLALLGCGDPDPDLDVQPPEPVEVFAGVDRAVATTGDVITYRLTVEHDADLDVEVPPVGSEIAGFRIVDLGEERRDVAGDRVEEAWWYELRADLVGSYVLPGAEVHWRETDGEGDWTTVETSQIFIEVASVLPEGDEMPEDIREIKPLRARPDERGWWALAAVVGLLMLGGAAFARYWLRSPPRLPPPPPAHEVAIAALNALRDVDVADAIAVRAWYFELSEVLRAYVEARFELNATDLTTEEILAGFADLQRISSDDRALLSGFLLDTDQVKYAASAPTEAGIEQSYERALGFVEATATDPDPPSPQGVAHE